MPYTIADARSQILDHLDDELGRRYAPDLVPGVGPRDYTKVDRALRSALNRCLDDYVAAGGDRFDEHIEVTTSADDGTVNLAAEEIAHIRFALVRPQEGQSLFPIESGDKSSSGLEDRTERTLQLTIVRMFPIAESPNEDDLLVGEVAGAARSWDAFDEWVVCRAALQLSIKDNEMRQALAATLADLRAACIGQKRNPGALPWPDRRPYQFLLQGQLRWLWFPKEQTFKLLFNIRGWGAGGGNGWGW